MGRVARCGVGADFDEVRQDKKKVEGSLRVRISQSNGSVSIALSQLLARQSSIIGNKTKPVFTKRVAAEFMQ